MLTQSFLRAPKILRGRAHPSELVREKHWYVPFLYVWLVCTPLWFPTLAGYSSIFAIPSAPRVLHPQISNPSPAHPNPRECSLDGEPRHGLDVTHLRRIGPVG